MSKRKILTMASVALICLYVGAYLVFRSQHIERWETDGSDYLIFPTEAPAVYYLFRPLTYIDGRFTGLKFHIGPHR